MGLGSLLSALPDCRSPMSAWPWRLGLANLSCAIFKITRRGRGRDNNKRGVVHNIVWS